MAKPSQRKKGLLIIIITKASHGGLDKGASIHAWVFGHGLSVSFSKSLGPVDVEIVSVEDGGTTVCFAECTPGGMNIHILQAGAYIVNFTLANGDEYYGEFEIMD